MKTLHTIIMATALTALLAVGAGVLQPWHSTAAAQHGQAHGDDPDAHFNMIAERLALTDAQRETLARPIGEAMGAMDRAIAAMQRLHELHDVIAADLTDEQQETFATMMHEAMAGVMQPGQHSEHDEHSGEGHR